MTINNAGAADHKAPLVSGQCAEVLELIRKHGPILSLELTANCAIPETAARVHDLRNKGFNIQTQIMPSVSACTSRVRAYCSRNDAFCTSHRYTVVSPGFTERVAA